METVKNNGEIVLYQPDSSINMEVVLENDTLWLTLDNLSELYQRDKSTISRHLRNIFDEGELDKSSTVANFATVQNEGGRAVKRYVDYYNLDAIISVGYRVKSRKGIEFRKWGTVIIKNHIIKTNSINVRVDKVEEEVLTMVGHHRPVNAYCAVCDRIFGLRSYKYIVHDKTEVVGAVKVAYGYVDILSHIAVQVD